MEKGDKEHKFTVPFHVKADDIDEVCFRIVEGIENVLKNEKGLLVWTPIEL